MDEYEDYSDPNEQKVIDDEVERLIDEEAPDNEPTSLNQHTLLSYATADDSVWTKVSRIIKPEYFDNEYRAVVKFVLNHVSTYKKLPSRLMIKGETGVTLPTPDDAHEEESQQYVADQLEKHCKSRYADIVALKLFNINSGEEKGDLVSAIKQAHETITGMTLHRDLGFEVHDSVLEQLEYAESHDNIPTGFTLIDRALGGGTTRPSFNLVSAGSGIGKSVTLQNLSVNYVEYGENVLYITLELIPPLVEKRFTAMMTNTHIDQVYRFKQELAVQMHKRGQTEGRLWATKLPMSGTDPVAVEALYHELCREHKIRYGVVVVDYIDVMTTLRPGVKLDNIHLRDKFIAEDLNDFIHRNDLIGWSASQQTKGSEDDKGAKQGSVAGGQPKISALDNLIIIKRSEDDMADQKMWGHISKGRSGGSMLKVPLTFNRDTLRMGDGTESDFYEANPWFYGKKKGEASNGHSDRIKKDRFLGAVADKIPVAAEKQDDADVSKKHVASTIRERLAQKKEDKQDGNE